MPVASTNYSRLFPVISMTVPHSQTRGVNEDHRLIAVDLPVNAEIFRADDETLGNPWMIRVEFDTQGLYIDNSYQAFALALRFAYPILEDGVSSDYAPTPAQAIEVFNDVIHAVHLHFFKLTEDEAAFVSQAFSNYTMDYDMLFESPGPFETYDVTDIVRNMFVAYALANEYATQK